MKKNFILLFALLINLVYLQAQTTVKFQATIKSGTQANTVILAIRPLANVTAAKISTLYFSIAVPATAVPRPSVSVKTNYNTNIGYTVDTANLNLGVELVNGSPYWIYNILGDGGQASGSERDYTTGVDNNMVELAFNRGPLSPVYTVRTVSLPNGGISQNAFFNIFNLGTDVTNTSAMFYGVSPVNSAAGYGGTSYTDVSNITLPTKFLSFYANKSEDNAKLTWSVDNEEDNAYFEVEASTDARTFKTIQKVDALRNGRSSNTYTLTDNRISRYNTGIIYYRIKQVEASGKTTYSDVRQISLEGKNFVAALYPNPVKTITRLIVEAPEAGKATVIIRDATGKAVKQLNLQLQKGTNQQELDASAFAAGDYNVTIISDKLNQTIKMTKSN